MGVNACEKAGPWYEIVGVVGQLGMNEMNAANDAGLYQVLFQNSAERESLSLHSLGGLRHVVLGRPGRSWPP